MTRVEFKKRTFQFFVIDKFIVVYFFFGILFVLVNTIGCITLTHPTEAEWKSYVNRHYHFRIVYPMDWKLRESLHPIYPDTFLVQVFFNSPSKQKAVSLRVYPKDDEGMIFEALNVISKKRVTVGDIEGVKIIAVSHKEGVPSITMTLIRKDSYLYIFEGEGDTFNKMLSTFTFIQ